MSYSNCPVKIAAQSDPSLLAWECDTNTLTFRELDRKIDQLHLELDKKNIGLGSLVVVLPHICVDLIALFFAVWRCGASILPLPLRLPSKKIQTLVHSLSPHLFIGSFPMHFSPLKTLQIFPPRSLFLFTSGSSGEPKIAVLSLENLLYSAKDMLSFVELGKKDRWLISLPLYHVGGIGIMIRSILAKATLCFLSNTSQITHISYVPTQVWNKSLIFPKLKCLLLGGAPLLVNLPQSLPYYFSYGLTEMGSTVTATYRPNSLFLGHPLPGRELKLSSEGEILVRGHCLFQGYWSQNTLTQSLDSEGWFHTKDLGFYSSKEGLMVTGRKDRQFISGGENIQPEEIEKELLKIPSVKQAVVMPIKDLKFGQKPVACIEEHYQEITVSSMQAILANTLPKFKIPCALFIFETLPLKGLKPDLEKLKEWIDKKSKNLFF